MKSNWLTKKLEEALVTVSPIAPIISGCAALYLLDKIIFSSLDYLKFVAALILIGIIFLSSVFLYYFLKKLSQDKDKYLISSVGKILDDLFVKYGSSSSHVDPENMNKILNNVIEVIHELKDSISKDYVNK